jgi:hypothetical protein
MTERRETYVVEPAHMAAFGSIVQHFARHEYLMQGIMCAMLKVPLSNVAMMTSGLGYAGKRDALRSLLRDVEIAGNLRERIVWFMGELHKHNQLRNHVAHSMWKEGTRPGSIKPIGADPRGGDAKYLGLDPSEKDYLLVELIEIADELGHNLRKFMIFLDGVGLMLPKHPAEN